MATIETSHTAVVTLTERAAEKIKSLMAQEPAGEAEVLRVAIQGGGCSGFEYALGFDRGATDGDHELELHGVRLVVDPFSAPYLQGSTVDFLETIQEAGFKIDNPNAVGSCGCGHSFQVEEGQAPAGAGGCSSCA
jgi:iron-sulfur cluster assembly accessory protein